MLLLCKPAHRVKAVRHGCADLQEFLVSELVAKAKSGNKRAVSCHAKSRTSLLEMGFEVHEGFVSKTKTKVQNDLLRRRSNVEQHLLVLICRAYIFLNASLGKQASASVFSQSTFVLTSTVMPCLLIL